MPATKPLYWTGPVPDECQVCNKPFGAVMYDAHITSLATWGNICHDTFVVLGCSLGVGKGQKFELQEDGRWLCTAGSERAMQPEEVKLGAMYGRPIAAILSDEDKRAIRDEAEARR